MLLTAMCGGLGLALVACGEAPTVTGSAGSTSVSKAGAGNQGVVAPAATTSGTAPSATREVLGQAPALGAPGLEESLMRITMPAGTALAPHRHPGQQVSRIEAGVLSYTLVSGSAQVGRNGASQPTETVQAPADIELRAGDTLYEPDTLVHFGKNNGTEPVVILLATLLRVGEPVTINVEP